MCVFQSSVDAIVQGSNSFPKKIEIYLQSVGWEWTPDAFSGHSPILLFSVENKIVGVNEVSPDQTTILMVHFQPSHVRSLKNKAENKLVVV